MCVQPSKWLLAWMAFVLCGEIATAQIQIPQKLGLAEARRLLLKHNPILGAAQAGIEAENSDVFSASRRPNPRLGFTSEGVDFDSGGSGFFSDQETSVTLAYTIETSGKRRKRTRVQELEVEITRIDRDNLIRQLIYELEQTYFQVVLAQENVELAQTLLGNFQKIVELDRIRFEKGEISGGELRRVEVEQYRLLEELISSEVQLDNARNRLIALLGSDALDQPLEAVDSFDSSWRPVSEAKLREIARQNREDLKAQRARLAKSGAEIELQKARKIPDITPFAGYHRDFGDDGAVVGINLTLPLFDRNRGKIARARAEESQRQWQLRLLEIEIARQVQLALNELRGNRRRLDRLENEFLRKAEQSRDISESAYRLGSASLVEFLDAQQTYWETRRLYNRALYDFEISRARLKLAVGKDGQP